MIKNSLKKIPFLLEIHEYFTFKKYYIQDLKRFCSNWINSKNVNNKKLGYNIILDVHSIEKGMTSQNVRRFGISKVKNIINCLKNYTIICENDKDYAYNIGFSALEAYCNFYEKNNWCNFDEYNLVKNFLADKNYKKIPVGYYILNKSDFNKNNMNYEDILNSRHSIRDFSNKKISEKDFLKAVSLTTKTPTACNRQMCKIYFIENDKKREDSIKYGHGLTNFNLNSVNLFVITYDISSFCCIDDRNQGWFNSGLIAMNFVNSLHYLGIGSCFIQFGNAEEEEKGFRSLINIPDNEKIAVMIAAGYYKNETKITYSSRKPIEELYKIIK